MSHPAKLEISRNTIDRGERRLDVLAPITKRASGEVQVELHGAGRRYRFAADVNSDKGYIRFDKRIPRAQARLGTGIVTITYPGNARTRGQEVRLRAASGRAQLDAQRPELEVVEGALRLQSAGKLSERARGVVRVQLDWVDSAGVDRSYEANAKIDDGAWRLSEELPGEVRQSIEGRRSTVHSYTLFTGYLRARMRGEMKAYQTLGEPIVDSAANPAGPAPLQAEEGLPASSPTEPPASSPTESTASSPPPSTMRAGDSLLPGDRLVSPNAAYQLVMQHDGNLALYQGTNALWSSATSAAGARADMQSDGNFVVRNGSTAEWHSHTAHYPNAAVHLQDDGNLVIRHAGRPVWTRGHGHVGDAVNSGQTLGPRAIARSDNGAYRLIMQGDGNLVLYQSKTALWSSATKTADSRAVMQTDGNLVISSGTAAKWKSQTDQYTGAALKVQDDGNLVIYHGGRPVWTRANGHIGHLLQGGQKLDAGELARSNNATYRLIMQGDGNLVLYKGGSALWSTKTNASGSHVEMQTDGNLVVYSGTTAKWNTGTAGNPGAYLAVQDDGNLVIYKGGAAIWTRASGGTGQYSPPDWWPLRGSNRVGCARNSSGSICGGNYHSWWAIDVDAPEGQPIYAAGAGRASVYSNNTGCTGGYGRAVAIDHGGGVRSLYAHMSNFAPGIDGAWVGPNTVIGYVGHTGETSRCAFNHLHYEETNGSFGSGARDPGELQACIGSQRVSYPSYWGRSSWDGLPGQTFTARSDSIAC